VSRGNAPSNRFPLLQLDAGGFKAAAGAANQVNTDSGATIGTALGYEIILT
jgi:hypothetical protein